MKKLGDVGHKFKGFIFRISSVTIGVQLNIGIPKTSKQRLTLSMKTAENSHLGTFLDGLQCYHFL